MAQTKPTTSPTQGEQSLKATAFSPEPQEQVPDQLGLRRDQCLTFSRREAAEVLGVSLRTLDRLVQQGELRFVGSTHRFSRAAVLAYVHGTSIGRRVA